ncbi:hypothetical protein GCM10022234_16700 [Aeromicrobium panaciterrae]|uniref:AAA family ATPase n=1 Tax=Aeromicrobium panaciterrae TaxID=363861 RepID=UPI0031D334D7
MIIVVSGTHACGKTSLIDAFATAQPQARVLPDPFEVLDQYQTDQGAGIFYQQLEIAAARILEPHVGLVIAERGPLDFLAYLDALERLERPTPSREHFRQGTDLCVEAMKNVDLVVLLPLNSTDRIDVPADEDPDLRTAMDEALLELADDPDLTGRAEVVELAGASEVRLVQLERLVALFGD